MTNYFKFHIQAECAHVSIINVQVDCVMSTTEIYVTSCSCDNVFSAYDELLARTPDGDLFACSNWTAS